MPSDNNFSIQLKYKMQRMKLRLDPFLSICMVCNSKNCKESTDHHFLPAVRLIEIVHGAQIPSPYVECVKKNVSDFYSAFSKNIVKIIGEENRKVQEYLNRWFFPHLLAYESSLNVNLLCEIRQGNLGQLPSKKAWKLVKTIDKITGILNPQQNYQTEIKSNFEQKQFQIQRQINQFDFTAIVGKLQQNFMSYFILPPREEITVNWLQNFEEAKAEEDEVFEWRNLRIKKNMKNISLSKKKLDDSELILNGPKLDSFHNIVELDMRTNLLTHLSCSIFQHYLPQLLVLDLRRNEVGDEGVRKLQNLNKMKQLMLCENKITDTGAICFNQGFPSLEILWLNENNVTEIGALSLCEKPILKILSAIGNPIHEDYHQEINMKFTRKGLFYI